MKTIKTSLWRQGACDIGDKLYGPPLPRSLQLWNMWGCYEHTNCFVSSKLENGEWVTHHENPILFWMEHITLCRNSPTCPYFIHYLVGDREAPGREGDETWMHVQSKRSNLT